MQKMYLILLMSLGAIYMGYKDIVINSKKDIKHYYSGMNFLISGIMFLVVVLAYIFYRNDWIMVFGGALSFLTSGIYGIWNRKKIKNYLMTRQDYMALIIGLMLLVPVILYMMGYFNK